MTGWWFQTFFYCIFTPIVGEDSHFDSYFSNGLKPPTSIFFALKVIKLQFSEKKGKSPFLRRNGKESSLYLTFRVKGWRAVCLEG